MAEKLLISISAQQVSAARWHGGHCGHCEVFPYSDTGLAAFATYLDSARKAPVHIMVDAVEEDYRIELLPHSYGGERNEMVKRKLRQHYRNTTYFSAVLQGRDTAKRRDDRYLFCALTNPDLIADWVKPIIEHALPIAGIYLLPTATRCLVQKLDIKLPNLLVVSMHSSGLRLTCLRDQRLRVSRLARIDSKGPEAIKSYAEEISNTRLYLHALRVMTLDEQLSVPILDRDDTLAPLAQTVAHDNPNIECRRLGRGEIIDQLGVNAESLESSSDALFMHLMGTRAPESNLAPTDVTYVYRRQQARRSMFALAAACGVAAALWLGFNWYEIYNIRSDTEASVRQTAQLQEQYLAVTRQFPAAPTTADNLQRAVEISQRIGSTMRSPETMMAIISKALEANPKLVLETFGWKYGTTPIDADSSSAATTKPGDMQSSALGGGQRRQSGFIEGEVRPFRGDYRAAIETIDRFRDSLAQQQEVAEVKVVKLPLNISPTLVLNGNTTASSGDAGKAEFKLQVTLKDGI